MKNKNDSTSTYSFLRKVLIFVVIALAVTLLVMFVGEAIDTLLIIFAGILLGTIFRSARDFIHQKLRLGHGISLTLVILIFLATVSGLTYVLAPSIANQVDTFYQQLPETWEMTKQEISRFGWGRELAQENPHIRDFFEDETDQTGEDYDMTKSILGYLSTTATIIAALVLVFVIAVYIAAEPTLYSEGFVRMFPKKRRERVLQIMNEIAITIQWWIVGQVVSMIILGTLATLGLWLLGVPYALLLGVFTALMTFIPNLGPIIAAVPILLISLTVGLETAIYTGIFYAILQGVEGYFITPMIHRRAISVPPVLIITIQFLLYYLIGFMGVLLAMPLMGCVMVLVKRLYIQDILGDPLEERLPHDLRGDNIF
ncbi:AI-2E family transporter [Fodinibius sediminis]|uniref:Predicted PurR-regulated permease PerM n=1 Tax=Fodinibius sediminis TaxID=1214077 RepID=A0A521DBJ1_9BACT|nr:AI-2E family transporter [Fodinibius sediminis]SMO68270.1 Predicted PurR-regulated permease PerM [Fodinibius sediminis]